ncbi:kinase-like domain-containing protein [Gigaspora rosea]|uniref:Kinase-like domain-containing protein n=1 Tax=Gigaspora rosea TaxID=44941 RepID=A0A397UJQ2_9GLOM|nr:kinase-like domain-containing protein [Gigaspora rosea]
MNKKSDIYSIGVILWEISSENPPFKDEDMATLPFKIRSGLREKPIADTNRKYITIYEQCWQGMQDKRPFIQEVAMELKNIMAQDDDNFNIDDINSIGKFIDNKLSLYENMENDLKELIKKHKIAKYDYYEFSKLEKIGRGAFGTVHKARWGNLTIALKNINKNDNTNQAKVNGFLSELQHLAKLCKHENPNIIEFLELRKDHYYLILQFAVDGNLRQYLKKNFSELRWVDKLRIAHEIAKGLLFLHDNGIIHRDLHSKNILVHKRRILIADFGVSKHIGEETRVRGGMNGYLDPQCFINFQYKCDKRSDIYSFGVVLWEISSGRPPFDSFEHSQAVIIHVYNEDRESPVENTPDNYVKLYQHCWDQDPARRPETKAVLEDLKNIRSNEEFSTVITAEHEEEIISWIDPSSSCIKHLKLILRGSRDGFTKSIFYEKCRNIDKTVIVLKVQVTGEILGGYNPLTLNMQKWKKYKETNDSFIFALNKKGIGSIYSKVKRADHAICCIKKNSGPSFGYSDLYMHSKKVKIWKCCPCDYETPIKIIDNGSQKPQKFQTEKFQIEDYEVFQYS